MLLTLFTDASHCPKTGAGGWGAWAKRSDWPAGQLFGGVLPRHQKRGWFETEGAALAIKWLGINGHLDGVEAVLVRCDSLASLQALADVAGGRFTEKHDHPSTKRRQIPQEERKAALLVRRVLGDRGLWLRHIKGHAVNGTNTAWVNKACDQEARKQMVEMRDRIFAEDGRRIAKKVDTSLDIRF